MSSAGEPPGHTHRPFCRDGSPKVLERSGQNVFWSPSALRRYATQRTHTKRNNATRTQRRDANTLAGTAEGRQLGNRSRRTQLQRHEQLPRRLERPHPALCSANEARIAVTFRQREGMILSTRWYSVDSIDRATKSTFLRAKRFVDNVQCQIRKFFAAPTRESRRAAQRP